MKGINKKAIGKLLRRTKKLADRYKVNPAIFICIYFFTIPLFIVTFRWVIDGLSGNLSIEKLFLRLLLSWIFLQAPSIYILLFGHNIPWKFELIFFLIFILVGYIYFNFIGLNLSIILSIGILLIKLGQAKKHFDKITVKIVDPMNWVDLIAKQMRNDYAKKPWDENYRCPICIPSNDFDALATKYKKCLTHRIATRAYWDVGRVKTYLSIAREHQDFLFLGAFKGTKLVGFIWGYRKDILQYRNVFYIDVIHVDNYYRVNHGSIIGKLIDLRMLLLIVNINRKRISKISKILLWFFRMLPLSPIGLFYQHLNKLLIDEKIFGTRTHRNALNVKTNLLKLGFKPIGSDSKAPDRIYYLKY